MPYNTRRKSLSLPSLGIQVPSARSHRSPSASKIPATTEIQPPPKRVKRSHDSSSLLPLHSTDNTPSFSVLPPRNGRGSRTLNHTPPPSPADGRVATKIDTQGINDDIIIAVIEQLEKTGNRPHLIKELAGVLTNINETIANSANAAALISSRLSLYLKRPWTALSPCPIAKEQIPVHPRKVFFYLTNSEHQPLPNDSDDIMNLGAERKQITPSLSGASVDLDDVDDAIERQRARMSPSPEVDLSSPAFDHEAIGDNEINSTPGRPPTPAGSYSMRSILTHSFRLSHSRRGVSPPLEGDEKEFTLTASSVRERASAEDISSKTTNDSKAGEDTQIDDETEASEEFPSHEPAHARSHEYDDYFASQLIQNQSDEDGFEMTVSTEVLGTSPSPSMASEISSISSVASNPLDGEVDSVELSKSSSQTQDLGSSPSKIMSQRSVSVVGTDYIRDGALASLDIHMGVGLDSWIDLQSPEAMDIHELDAMFGDI